MRPRGVSPCLGHPLPSYHHLSLRTFRRDSDSDSDNDGPRSGSSPGRWPQKQYDRRGRRSSPDNGWDERIAGSGDRRGFDGPRDRHRPAWATSTADPEEDERRPSSRAAREDRGGGGGSGSGGGGQRSSGRVLAEDWNRRAATDEEAAAVPTGRRPQQAGAKDVGPVGPSLLVQLRTAGSWEELQRILNSVAPHPLSPREVATATVTYCKLVNGVQAAAPPALAPAGLYDDHKHDYGRGVGGGGAAAVGAWEPPPPGLRERLQANLLATAAAVPLRELSYCLFSLSMTPKAVSLLTDSAVAAPGQVTEALVTRLEDVLYDKVLYGSRHRTLSTSKGKGRRLGGATAAAAAAAPGGGEDDGRQLVQCLTYLCTAVRRLRIARPSVHRALAAAAAPLLGRELAGEELAPLVITFLGAGNPEPLFMEQLVHQSSLPYSLERTSSVFACTVLLRAAGQTGAEPPVLDPLAARLCELLRESLLLKKQQEQLTEQHPPSDAVEAAGDAAGNADGDAAGDANGRSEGGGGGGGVAAIDPAEGGDGRSSPSSLPSLPLPSTQQQQQQQLPGRRRPSRSDMQIVYVLQACAAAGLGPDSELVQLLVQEAKRQQSGWDMLHRLLTSRFFNALGINVVAPASAASPPPSAGATAASTAAAAAATSGPPEQPQAEQRQQQGQGRQQQQHLGLREEEREEEDLVLIREEEVLDFLRQETMTLTSLLPVLYGLSQLRSRPHARGIGGGGAAAAADGDEHDTADGDVAAAAAAAAPAAGHPNRMPTALGVAVQLVDAAAPLMAPKHVVRALSSLAAAGVVTPPSLLQRAEQLYKEQLASVGGAAAAAVDGEDAGGGLGGLDGLDFGADSGSVEGTAGTASVSGTAGTASVSQQRDAAVPNPDRGGGGGGGRSLAAMCAIVGRVLAWQPGAAAAAMLSDDFVRHCHDVAVDASRGGGRGRWLE